MSLSAKEMRRRKRAGWVIDFYYPRQAILVKLPVPLHEKLKQESEIEWCSMNGMIVAAVEDFIKKIRKERQELHPLRGEKVDLHTGKPVPRPPYSTK